eukprot:TRINITY_DN563_c0_g4_i4.p1 TRINITY_DN563_c0_g4~~TRINITY_DN563_c0_g4_i4.p1  ORF type:complete len:193 (+),score=33.65 TRINITY_DN563_c0_g4_i4:353-931(+)
MQWDEAECVLMDGIPVYVDEKYRANVIPRSTQLVSEFNKLCAQNGLQIQKRISLKAKYLSFVTRRLKKRSYSFSGFESKKISESRSKSFEGPRRQQDLQVIRRKGNKSDHVNGLLKKVEQQVEIKRTSVLMAKKFSPNLPGERSDIKKGSLLKLDFERSVKSDAFLDAIRNTNQKGRSPLRSSFGIDELKSN